MREIYITTAKRTAIGSYMGKLSSKSAVELGSIVFKNIIDNSKIDPKALDDVIIGQVLTGGLGQNPARQTSMKAGIPQEVPAITINRVCGSGLQSVIFAAQMMKAGDGNLMIAGGQENMSLAHHGALIRSGIKFGDVKLTDHMMRDGLTDAFFGVAMGVTAENIAKKFDISRVEQDEFAVNSHFKSFKAQKEGYFDNEIVPVSIEIKKEVVTVDKDEGIRQDSNIEILSKLRPAFAPDGTVTAGNSSTINDGAAALLISTAEGLKSHGLIPLVRIVSYGKSGVDPSIMGTGPVIASQNALKAAGWDVSDLGLIESNEAFAAQAIYVNRNMNWDISNVNISGGAISLGHPIGASGARVLTTLIHNLIRLKKNKGLATLCIGGGMGIAMCVERV